MIAKTRAFTLIDLLMVIAVLALAAAFILPMLARSQSRSSRINCTNNLKQIGLSFKTFAIDNNDLFPVGVSQADGGAMESASSEVPWRHFQVMSNELSTPKILACPNDSARKAAMNFTSDFNNSRLSYFVNLDAKDEGTNMVLCGDRNLVIGGKAAEAIITVKSNSAVSWSAAIHQNKGNILMTDGSVSQLTSVGLQGALRGVPENGFRLAIP